MKRELSKDNALNDYIRFNRIRKCQGKKLHIYYKIGDGPLLEIFRPMGPVVSGLRRCHIVEYQPRGPRMGGSYARTLVLPIFDPNARFFYEYK